MNEKAALERQAMHFRHQLSELDKQAGLSAEEREKLRQQFQASLDDVNAKLGTKAQ